MGFEAGLLPLPAVSFYIHAFKNLLTEYSQALASEPFPKV